jgi:predicted metal-dependent hydrolase
MESKKVNLQGVGEVVLERSRRARHINLSVKPFRGVRIAVPRGVSFQQALAVAHAKSSWLRVHLGRMVLIEQQILALKKTPEAVDPIQARRILVARLAQLAQQHGFVYNRVFVRNQRTRWGSCSRQNNINLNINLVRLPAALRDYTILHELVHTRIKNHGPLFWQELAGVIPDARALDRELNRYWMLLVDTDRFKALMEKS